jgi:hypothetical protein
MNVREFDIKTTTKDISCILFSNNFTDILGTESKKDLKLEEEADIYTIDQ